MVFEEFFKKKRIDLAALQQAEQSLFFEFKDHFDQMGEKSFDHTKKYWFNKLRRRFPIAIEIKTEKVHIQNPIAEQTITESLIEPGTPPPKIGFTPKFRSAAAPKPAEEKLEEAKPDIASSTEETPAAPKPAFKPRFNPGMVKPKPAEDAVPPEIAKERATPAEETSTAPKPAFKPRFNAAMVKPKPAEDAVTPVEGEAKIVPEQPLATAEETPVVAKPAFKPRFNAAMMKPKPAESETPLEDKPEIATEPQVTTAEEVPAVSKPAFKPRFNAAMMKPKPAESEPETTEKKEEKPEVPPTDEPAAKPAYKPRFNVKNIPPKTTEE